MLWDAVMSDYPTQYASHRIYVSEFKSFGGFFAADIVRTIINSPEYLTIKSAGFRFRITMLLCYWVGGPWAEVLYEFTNLSTSGMILLALQDSNIQFNPNLDEIKTNDVPMGRYKSMTKDKTYNWADRMIVNRPWEN